VSDPARVLLTAAVLSLATVAMLAWRAMRASPDEPARLIGALRLAQWCAVLLAAIGAIPIGLALSASADSLGGIDAALGIVTVGTAGFMLLRDPYEALVLLAGAFVLHALIDLAHRPDFLSPALAPRPYLVGCAVYNVCLAAICFAARRR